MSTALAAHAQVCADAGKGAATPGIASSFSNACNRGGFPLATPTAIGNVKSLSGASPSLVQEFGAAGATAQTTAKSALVKADPNEPVSATDTLQVFIDIYTIYQSVGAATAGLPTTDTQACPTNSFGVCDYQVFSKNYALFAYSTPVTQSVTVADPFFTKWTGLNGIGGILGPATNSSAAVTSATQTSGTRQTFLGGEIDSYTLSGATVTYAVSGAIFTAFANNGGYSAAGFPTSDEIVLPSGLHRQTFQSARIEWTPGQTTAAIFFPVTNLDILGEAQGLTINAGATATLTATALDSHNNTVIDRVFTWSTANGAIAGVTGNGVTATVRGISSGTTNIYVSAEGKTSPPFSITVKGICCGIGEGAPTQAVSQAFQAAAARNNLAVTLPAATGVVRAGSGYTQTLTAADGSGTVYAIAQSDKSTVAYVMTGTLYAAYLGLGGFGGPLGYPASDPQPGGAQTFESGIALAGNPVRQIPAAIAKRWLALGGGNGSPGNPAADAAGFVPLAGGTGVSQLFSAGAIFAFTAGARTGQAFISTGLILARYLALGGPGGALGAPVSDLVNAGAAQSQNFEGGYIDLQAGAAAAVEHFNPRQPSVTIQPAIVAPGGRVRIAISGFAPGGGIAVAVTGQAGFTVSPAAGSFIWDSIIPNSAKPTTVTVQAKAATGSDAATASYTISPAAALLPRWTAISGDRQNGLPGAALQLPVLTQLADTNGNPIANIPVVVSASPGAVALSSGFTGADGRIAVILRLPPASGVAVLSLTAAGQVIAFSALATAATISGFPVFQGADTTLYTLAALIRFQQNAGLLASPNGLATPAALNTYLTSKAGYTLSDSGSSVANPWIAAQFAGTSASVTILPGTAEQIRDSLAAGSPAGVTLNLSSDGQPAGTTAVSAIGEAPDGTILISDPNPSFARGDLTDYLTGFTAAGHLIQGTIGSVIRVSTASSAGGFVVAAPLSGGIGVSSVAGPCAAALDLGGVRFVACNDGQNSWDLAFQSNSGAAVLDLAGGPPQTVPKGTGNAWRITRVGGALQVAPETLSITAVVDAATYGHGLAPGGLMAIFGTGFTPETAVTVNGQTVSLLASGPFQINAQLPATLTAGQATIQVANALGAATITVAVTPVAPTIFVIGTADGGGQQGAVVNQNGVVNGPASPAARGDSISIYCTGLGATSARNGLEVSTVPVTVVANGATLTPSYAGLAPGFIGLYQVNVGIPESLFPGLASSLQLKQGAAASNIVAFALQ